jgi:exodeoxyribonuclease-5
MNLTDMQKRAIDGGIDTLNRGGVYKVGGYAGTGKTTIAKYVIDGSGKRAIPCAFMGKAANCLRRKGVKAETIHSTIYEFDPASMRFNLKNDVPGDFFYLDEGSTVALDLWNDLRSFKKPIIVAGDPGQLEPVGKDAMLMAEPDIILDVDHRFGSEIAWFANTVRLGEGIPKVRINSVIVSHKAHFMKDLVGEPPDIVLCGFNRTRVATNKHIRRIKRYFKPLVPGEQVICLHNDRDLGVFNGMMMTITNIHAEGKHHRYGAYTYCDVEKDDGRKHSHLKIWHGHLDREKQLDWTELPKGMAAVDYGYCISVHKSQGSQYDDVMVIDEQCDLWSPSRHRYTAFTRASKRLRVYVD